MLNLLQKKMLTGVTCAYVYSTYAISDELSFVLLPCSDDEYVALYAVEGASEGWEKTVSRITKEHCVEICSKHSFSPALELFPEDEVQFVLKQRQPPMVTLEVPSDGSCFFRFVYTCLCHCYVRIIAQVGIPFIAHCLPCQRCLCYSHWGN